MFESYSELISLENIFRAWKKFSLGKTGKEDVIRFWNNLEDNIFELHNKLKIQKYKHGSYVSFIIRDPKKRIIHKAGIEDRIIHQIIFDFLRPIFEKRFIFDSYSSRIGKGNHKAVKRLNLFCQRASYNNTQSCWVLKCDIYKFFDNINHQILFSMIKKGVGNIKILKVIKEILDSFKSMPGKGLPLGNITSQLFANIYLHELDYFIKNKLRIKHYIRFNDDFVIIHKNKKFLEATALEIQKFLKKDLKLNLPDDKIQLRNLSWGIDFLGYIILPNGVLIRTNTRKRLLKNINKRIDNYNKGLISFNKLAQTVNSYLGVLKHCSSFKLRQEILNFNFIL